MEQNTATTSKFGHLNQSPLASSKQTIPPASLPPKHFFIAIAEKIISGICAFFTFLKICVNNLIEFLTKQTVRQKVKRDTLESRILDNLNGADKLNNTSKDVWDAETEKAEQALQNVITDINEKYEDFKKELIKLNKRYEAWSPEDMSEYLQKLDPMLARNQVKSAIVQDESPLSVEQYKEKIRSEILDKLKICHFHDFKKANYLVHARHLKNQAKKIYQEGGDLEAAHQLMKNAKKYEQKASAIKYAEVKQTNLPSKKGAYGEINFVYSGNSGVLCVKKSELSTPNPDAEYVRIDMAQEAALQRMFDHQNIPLVSSTDWETKDCFYSLYRGESFFNIAESSFISISKSDISNLSETETLQNEKKKNIKREIEEQVEKISNIKQIVETALSLPSPENYDQSLAQIKQIYEGANFSSNDTDELFFCLENKWPKIIKDKQSVEFLKKLKEEIKTWKIKSWRSSECNPFNIKKQLIPIMEQFIRVLIYLHKNNCLHNDMNLSNVLILPDSFLSLIDFGLMRQATDFFSNDTFEVYKKKEIRGMLCCFKALINFGKTQNYNEKNLSGIKAAYHYEKDKKNCDNLVNFFDKALTLDYKEGMSLEEMLEQPLFSD